MSKTNLVRYSYKSFNGKIQRAAITPARLLKLTSIFNAKIV